MLSVLIEWNYVFCTSVAQINHTVLKCSRTRRGKQIGANGAAIINHCNIQAENLGASEERTHWASKIAGSAVRKDLAPTRTDGWMDIAKPFEPGGSVCHLVVLTTNSAKLLNGSGQNNIGRECFMRHLRGAHPVLKGCWSSWLTDCDSGADTWCHELALTRGNRSLHHYCMM